VDGRDWSADTNAHWHVSEKLDGSQLSFALDARGTLCFYNRGKTASGENPAFRRACLLLTALAKTLDARYMYHGECLQSRRQNVLAYERVPRYCFVLFDVQDGAGRWLTPDEVASEAARVGLESVQIPHVNTKRGAAPGEMCALILAQIEAGELTSMLGGHVLEGVVLKHNSYTARSGARTTATKLKLVTDRFKEAHKIGGRAAKDVPEGDFAEFIGSHFDTSARFAKAAQHLREANTPADTTSALAAELDRDFDKEYRSLVCDLLWGKYGPAVRKAARRSLSQWVVAAQIDDSTK